MEPQLQVIEMYEPGRGAFAETFRGGTVGERRLFTLPIVGPDLRPCSNRVQLVTSIAADVDSLPPELPNP